jgi:hypothetical protein
MRTLDIGLDIDGPIYPYGSVLARWAESNHGKRPGDYDDHALTWYWIHDQWGITKEEFVDLHQTGVEAGVIFAQGDPIEGALSAVRRLHDAGHRIHYVTNRAYNGVDLDLATKVTRSWLDRHGFPIDTLTVSADKNAVHTDVFLDDSAANIEALIEAQHNLPVLWDRPHNQDLRYVVRVGDWHAFERVVSLVASAPF